MSQNNDQGRPNPSQAWYDNGQAPQSKRFPFGAGNGESVPETRNNWQVEAQYGPGGGAQHNGGPTPQSGSNPAGQWGNGGQRSDHPTGEQPQPQGYPQQGQQYSQQPYQQQSGGQGPQYQQNPQSGQGQPNQGGQYPPQGQQQYQQQPPGQQQGQQAFQGILDPHTGEIHAVPDLAGLQEADALLVVVSGPDSGSQILLDTDVVTVGRSPHADIFLDDVTVSRKHAEFIRTPSGFTLRDTGSLNGTYVGRQLIDSIELQNGADVQIGKFRMIFQQRPRS